MRGAQGELLSRATFKEVVVAIIILFHDQNLKANDTKDITKRSFLPKTWLTQGRMLRIQSPKALE